jgi:ParB family chromosome partitioning protein
MKPKQSIRLVKLAHLIGHQGNIRHNVGDLTELAASIQEHGILQPLIVTEHPTELDRYLIVGGHRRAIAAGMVDLEYVPCVVRHGLDEYPDEQLVVMLVENCQRRDLGAIEKAEAFGVLRDKQGLTLVEISTRTGLSESTVSHFLSLLELDAETREDVRTGMLPVGRATEAIKHVRAERRGTTPVNGSTRKGYRIRVEPAHLTKRHPLAQQVKGACDHSSRPLVGGVGCGQCWEQVIRADELNKISTGQGVSA